MRRTTVSSRFRTRKAGDSRALLALGLLAMAGLSGMLAGCGAGSEFLPSNLPGTGGGGTFLITTATLEDGVINRSYSKNIDTTGGTPPVTLCGVVAGALPPGMSVTPATTRCVLSGTPGASGTFNFTVRADDASLPASRNDTQGFTLVIRQEYSITGLGPDPLPNGVEDTAYNFNFMVTTNTTVGLTDVGQAGELGNGPLTNCTITGLPAGMTSSMSNLAGGSCQVTLGGAPNIGLTANNLPQLFTLTLSVTDTPITASNTPARTISQTNIDLTIHGPLAFSLITADPGSTTGCTLPPPSGGTFVDAAAGGNAPAAVTGRRYGNPSNATRCDLVFVARGGRPPYSWMTTTPAPTPIACAQSGANNIAFRCNSGGNGVSGATATLAAQVSDTGNAATASLTGNTDDQGHSGHVIGVNNEMAIDNQFLLNGVVGQPYSVTLRCDSGTGACGGTGNPGNAQALYTWSEVGGPANAQIAVSGTNVPQPGNGLYSGTPTTPDSTVNPAIQVTDDGNDTTPPCATAGTCPTFNGSAAVFARLLLVDASNRVVHFYDTGAPTLPFPTPIEVALDPGSEAVRGAFTPNGTFVVVVDEAEDQADIIDNRTQAVDPGGPFTLAGLPRGVVIGPATSPLANPDSWVAYVALSGTAIDVIDLDPTATGGTGVGTVTHITTTNPVDDVAITPTFAGPQTRLYYLDSAGQQVCVINAQPGTAGFQQEIDLVAGGGLDCIDISSGQTPQHIEITPNGLQALVTTTDGGGAPMGSAPIVRIDTDPASGTRDTVQPSTLIDLGTVDCFVPSDLRSTPNSAEVWVLCAPDGMSSGDRVARVNATTTATIGTIDLSGVSGGNPTNDIAFNISGSLAVVSIPANNNIVPITTSGPTVGTPVDTNPGMGVSLMDPEGLDHIRDPQLNTLIDVGFTSLSTAQRGKPFKAAVAVQGGAQPYTWSAEGLGAAGTACEGLSLEPTTGLISGMPVNAGACSFTVEVTDSTPGAKQSRKATATIAVK